VSVGFIHKEFVTMHGHTILKNVLTNLHRQTIIFLLLLLLLSVRLPVANALDVLQPWGLLYYP
jgi:hypothetical protein